MTYKILLFLSLVLLMFTPANSQIIPQVSNEAAHKFYIGVDNSSDRSKISEFFNPAPLDSLGVSFVINHYRGPRGTASEEAIRMSRLGDDFKKAGLKVVVNVETGNFNMKLADADGKSWVEQPGGLHLFKFPPEVLKSLTKSDAVWGIQYDELEHSQITRNYSITLRNPGVELVSLAEPTGMDFKSADEAVYKGAKSLVDECKNYGTKLVLTEHVWPVLFHNFARAGITPVYKQMKENWSNVWAACNVGACLQYDKEMWACLDLWNHNTYPGHSAQELWSNLLFAYWIGVDKAYVESIRALYSIDGQDQVRLTDRGEVFRRFVKEYLPANPRPYSFRDFEPEIAIIRFDDTQWGQGPGVYCTVDERNGKKANYYWQDWLFGAYNLRTSPESEEWIKAWHTLTHGMVNKKSISWNAGNVYEGMPYRCFAPANLPAVFDDNVSGEYLKSVKLAFLCGLYISKNTMEVITSNVRKGGLVVVTSKRFAPVKFASKYVSGTKEFKDGNGKWILTDDMAGDDLKKAVTPWLGNNNEIVLRFSGNRKVTMEISPDGKELQEIMTKF